MTKINKESLTYWIETTWSLYASIEDEPTNVKLHVNQLGKFKITLNDSFKVYTDDMDTAIEFVNAITSQVTTVKLI